MPRYLGLDWGPTHLRLVEAVTSGGQVEVRGAWSWPEPLPATAAEAEAAGRRLKDRLKGLKVKAAPVVASLGRSAVLCRDIRYPDVPADEVPAVVRFQAVKELAFAAEEAVIDYQLSPVPWPTGEKRAMAAVARRATVTALKKLCQAAGLTLAGIAPRPVGIVAHWAERHGVPASADEVNAVLVLANGGTELCVARGPELLYSRPLSGENDDAPTEALACLPEVKRALAAFTSQFPRLPVQSLFVISSDHGSRADLLASQLRLRVISLEPVTGPGLTELPPADRAVLTGTLGLIQAAAARKKLPVNFLSPKEPKPPVNRKRQYMIAAAAAVLLVVGGVGLKYYLAVAEREETLRALNAKKAELTKQVAGFADTEKRLEAIQAWAGGEMVVLDELYDLVARFPDQPGIRVTKVTWKPLPPAASAAAAKPAAGAKPTGPPPSAQSRPVGQFTLEATGESAEALDNLRRALEGERHWKLEQWERETPGPAQARAVVKVFRQEPKEYQTVLGKTKNVTDPRRGAEDTRRRGPGGFRPFGGVRP